MHFYEQDKAIEFNGYYKKIERKIKKLEQADIDIQEEKKRALDIKRSCEQSVSNGSVQMQAETTYQEGIKELEKVDSDLEKHLPYYTYYHDAESIQSDLDKQELNKEKITVLAKSTIALVSQIQNSDTRPYETEKAVVERIYRLAYNVIKSELIKEGHSIVLEWVKNDETSSSFINSLIEMDIALLDEETLTNDIIKDTLSVLKRDIKNCSYLDEGLILFIALQDEQNIDKIESSLLEIMKDITSSNERIEESESANNDIKDKIEILTRTIKKSRIYKEFGLTISLIAILIGLKYGAEKAVNFIGHKEYKTDVDYFSTEENTEAPSYPEYMEKIDNFGKTTLTAYDVWHQEKIFFGDYQRDVVTYDLSNIDMEALEDFLTYDFSELSTSNSTTETAEELDANELYDKAIVEILRLSQDANDTKFVPNEEMQKTFLVIVSCVSAVVGAFGGLAIIKSIINKMKTSHASKIAKKETFGKLQVGLEAYKRLCSENEEFKNRFLEMYQKFAQFVKDPNITSEYQKILKNNNGK